MRPVRTLSPFLASLLLAVSAPTAAAQDPPPAAEASAARELRVFLDCERGCDFDFLRTETPWVEYVRDRMVADVHVLVTRLGTAAGGQEYTLAFIGQDRFAGRVDTLRLVARPGQAPALVRDGLARTIHLGLVPFAARTSAFDRLRVTAVGGGRPTAVAGIPADDRWNAWVFRVGLGGSFDQEERQRELELRGSLDARRITERWKFGASANANVERERFRVDDRYVTNVQESYAAGGVAVRSLGPHWGTGLQGSVSSSVFNNTRLQVRLAPAVEYSVWPYAEAQRRQLTLQYSLGVSSFQYREETIFDRLEETRPTQAFVAGYDVAQPWGSADAELEVSNYVDNLDQYRVELDGRVDLRLIEGFQLEVGGSASLIRDQLAIVKRDATPEEVLLRRRALLTDYRYSAFVGISYTFGSIYNSVVNPRFGTGPGQILR